ncbi:MAG: hypothetical protein KGL39_24055, partial [Patescibacteria group bacterium]|nr:hypothetical protein [Patescibacteria group bacterium]
DIFESVRQLIRAEATAAAASSDPALRAVGRRQLAETEEEFAAAGAPDPTAEASFLDGLREKIARHVDERLQAINATTPGAIIPAIAEGIKKDAVASVMG